MANNQGTTTSHPQDELLSIGTNLQQLKNRLSRLQAGLEPGLSKEQLTAEQQRVGLQIEALQNRQSRFQIEAAAEKETEAHEEKSKERGLADKERDERIKKERKQEKTKKEHESARHTIHSENSNEATKQQESNEVPRMKPKVSIDSPLPPLIPNEKDASTLPNTKSENLTSPHNEPGGMPLLSLIPTVKREIKDNTRNLGKGTEIRFENNKGELSYTLSKKDKRRTSKPVILVRKPKTPQKSENPTRAILQDVSKQAPVQNIETTRIARANEMDKQNAPEKTSKDTLMYTSGGFIAGKITPKDKERSYAKNETKTVGTTSQKKADENQQLPPPPALNKHSSFWNITKKPVEALRTTEKGVAIPIKKVMRLLVTKHTSIQPPKVAAVNLQRKDVAPPSKPVHFQAIVKTWLIYQKEWNNSHIKSAINHGYDRFILLAHLTPLSQPGHGPVISQQIPIAHARNVSEQRIYTPTTTQLAKTPTNTSSLLPKSTRIWSGYGKANNPSANGNNISLIKYKVRKTNGFNNVLGRRLRGEAGGERILPPFGRNNSEKNPDRTIAQTITNTFWKTPELWPILGSAAFIFIIIVFVLTIVITATGGTGGNSQRSDDTTDPGSSGESGIPPTNTNPIPGLTLSKGVSAATLTQAEEITYTISYNFTQNEKVKIEGITIYDTVPDNTTLVANKTTGNFNLDSTGKLISWPLSDPANQALKSFSFTVTPQYSGTFLNISNSAYATANGTVAPAGPGGQSSNSCTQPHEGTGYCSYENLLPYFNNQPEVALTASLICQLESGSNPFQTNKVCPDYSIGLFQINLVAHCGGAYANLSCSQLVNPTIRAACEQRFLDPTENINYAYQLYLSGGTGYNSNKWSVYPRVQSILASCANI